MVKVKVKLPVIINGIRRKIGDKFYIEYFDELDYLQKQGYIDLEIKELKRVINDKLDEKKVVEEAQLGEKEVFNDEDKSKKRKRKSRKSK
jgi:hypothetical protein